MQIRWHASQRITFGRVRASKQAQNMRTAHKGRTWPTLVPDVTDTLFAFGRLVNPEHCRVFDRIFEKLESGPAKIGDTSDNRAFTFLLCKM